MNNEKQRFTASMLIALFLSALIIEPAFAQGGLSSVNTFMSTVINLLRGAGVLIITIAILWCGYRIAFKSATFGDVAMIFLGGLFIGGASTIASYLIPSA